ncbi:helix-turn-helix domain containing protein [Enterococcus hulanensis]|uniref:Helix-turn-helix domain containing protein n=1 Tax=Enterococcus hulanensis TaxID=2559929 RepID=A0ABU3F1N3_9ENTE|nr:helix-turn-helix domain containing protein [Enterococcus hulanensis]MDT2601020.1 helix-turn-helix domain containing protein [Enterococcus hulanensis]MDT2610498.1 helix-turn-helix domain containing protein [Enterococcus hulanensis]MDT2617225.1 helix-turn-helix domain containing protein [Enterococcus hulanensis]
MKNWTTKEIQYLKKNALLAETNVVLNIEQLAKKLGRSTKSVDVKIYKLRRDGQFPPTDFTKSFDSRGRRFTENDDKRIMAMYKNGATYKEIGDSLDRSEQSIAGRIARLKKTRKLKHTAVQRNWTQKEVDVLLANIKFDENGFCCNHTELGKLCDRTFEQVVGKINRLRKEGILEKPKKGTTSVKAKESMTRFNDARFAHVSKKKEEVLMNGSTVNQSDVSIESKQVSLILTTVIVSGQRTDQYFTQEGELIATTKKPTSGATEAGK